MSFNITKLVRREILEIKPYIPAKPIEEIEREYKVKNFVQLISNENPFSVSSEIRKRIQKELKTVNRYPDGGGFYVKKKLAEKFKVKSENIILGNGGDEVLSMLCEAFLNKGEEVIIGQPSFSAYEISCRIMGGVPVFVQLENFKFDLKNILKKITRKTKIIFICNPNNPTGTIVEEKEVIYFLKHIPENILVVFDEAYSEYVENKNFPDTLSFIRKGHYKNVISIRTFSKIYSMAGLRIGYGIGDEEVIKYMNIVRKPYNVNSLAQAVAVASLSNNLIVSLNHKLNKKRKQYLYSSFIKLGINFVPTETNFIFVNTGMDSKDLCEKLIYHGVLVRAGYVFGYSEFIRVTIGKDNENKKLVRALSKIKKGVL